MQPTHTPPLFPNPLTAHYACRRARILALLHPATTVMDLNIGAALWLAAGAQGVLRLPPPPPTPGTHTCVATPAAAAASCSVAVSVAAGTAAAAGAAATATVIAGGAGAAGGTAAGTPDKAGKTAGGASCAPGSQPAANEGLVDGQRYTSAARVVLLGHGADEQCAGYGRHRTRWVCGLQCGLPCAPDGLQSAKNMETLYDFTACPGAVSLYSAPGCAVSQLGCGSSPWLC